MNDGNYTPDVVNEEAGLEPHRGRPQSILTATIPAILKFSDSVLLIVSGLCGLVIGSAILFRLRTSLPRGSNISVLLGEDFFHALIPTCIFIMFCWALCICFFRWLRLRAVNKTSHKALLMKIIGALDTREDLGRLALELDLPAFMFSPLLRRLRAVVEQWNLRPSLQNADIVLQQHVAVDSDFVQAGYSLIRIFIWALPVLGLVGTVLGIAQAVGGFASFLGGNVDDVSVIKVSLVNVTGGLSFAFMMTLEGLMASLIVMLLTSPLQTREEKTYASVQQDISDYFLPKLQRLIPEFADSPKTQFDFRLIDQLDERHRRFLQELDERSRAMRDESESAFARMDERHATMVRQTSSLVKMVGDESLSALGKMDERHEAFLEEMRGAAGDFRAESKKAVSDMTASVIEMAGKSFDRLNAAFAENNKEIGKSAQDLFHELVAGAVIQRGALTSLSEDLRQVGQEQVRILSVIRDGLMNADEILKAQLDTLSKWYPEMRTVLEEHTLSLESLPNVLQGPIQMLTTTLQNQLNALAHSVDRLVESNFNEQFINLTAALSDQERQLGNSTDAVRELAQITRSVLESQAALEASVSQLHELGFEKALSALRETLAALGPILDGFRRPFVLQAVQLDLVNPPAAQGNQQGAA